MSNSLNQFLFLDILCGFSLLALMIFFSTNDFYDSFSIVLIRISLFLLVLLVAYNSYKTSKLFTMFKKFNHFQLATIKEINKIKIEKERRKK